MVCECVRVEGSGVMTSLNRQSTNFLLQYLFRKENIYRVFGKVNDCEEGCSKTTRDSLCVP